MYTSSVGNAKEEKGDSNLKGHDGKGEGDIGHVKLQYKALGHMAE